MTAPEAAHSKIIPADAGIVTELLTLGRTAVLTVMKKHVKTHDCLSWNMNVVTPALLGMRFQNSAAERAAAMADHRPNMPNVG